MYEKPEIRIIGLWGRDLNQGPPEYEVGLPVTRPGDPAFLLFSDGTRAQGVKIVILWHVQPLLGSDLETARQHSLLGNIF
jgi:hypothetical protein